MIKTYEITEALGVEFIGITFVVNDGDDAGLAADTAMEESGYSDWCEENGYGSYDFEYEEVEAR